MKKDENLLELIDLLNQVERKLDRTRQARESPEILSLIKNQIKSQRQLLSYYDDGIKRISHLESLVDASRVLNSTLDLEELLTLFMEVATRELRADRSTLYLVDEKNQELWSMITQGPEMVEIRLPIGQGIAGKVAATGEIINIDDPYNDPRFYREIDKQTGYITRNILCMPMRNKEAEIIGVMQILNKFSGPFNQDDEFYLENLSLQASIAVENAKLHKEALERRRLEAELKLAFQIQMNLLPDVDPQLKGYSISGLNVPCLEVGGDYYDFISLAGKLGIAIGDVCGKGIPASLIMANLQAALRVLAPTSNSPGDIVDKINKLLQSASTPNKFITFFYSLLDLEQKTLVYTNAGHNPPIVLREGNQVELLSTESLILGAFHDAVYPEKEIGLESGDMVIFYTDGITETANNHNEQFGEERLIELVRTHRLKPVTEIKDIIMKSLATFSKTRSYFDDVTLILMKVEC